MRHLRKINESYLRDFMSDFLDKLRSEVESEYGFYGIIWEEEKGDYTIKLIFVSFDGGSAGKMNQLSERFGYDWDMEIEYLEFGGKWKYYMVVRYIFEEETLRDIFEDMDITKDGMPISQIKKYNL